ncbi:MAG TPA: hypothetical protein VJB92_02100 [Candidatus Paceibacterota bacterium]
MNPDTLGECSVCKHYFFRSTESEKMGIILLGADDYAICICCRQAVSKPWTDEYKARWQVWANKLREMQRENRGKKP